VKPYYRDDQVTLYHGDCIDVLALLSDASIDAVVTDPPYLLGFMGRDWDSKAAHEHLEWHGAWAAQCLRILKPGGHLLAFGGSRTWHRLACAVEDAGFEIRDSIAWLYGSGFPKSLDVSKAIDKAAGAEREVVGARVKGGQQGGM
jgi:DNA modification methylase